MYRDEKDLWVLENVTKVPDANFIKKIRTNKESKFSGDILINNWDGSFKRGLKISWDGSTEKISSNTIAYNKNSMAGNSVTARTICQTTDWYTCAYPAHDPSQIICTFNYSSTACVAEDGLPQGGGGNVYEFPSEGGGNSGYTPVPIWVESAVDGNGVPNGALCGTYNWKVVGENAYYAQIRNVGFSLVNLQGGIVTFNFAYLCVQLPRTEMGNAIEASKVFNAAWKYALGKVTEQANCCSILGDLLVKQNMEKYMDQYLFNNVTGGCSLAPGGCSGNIPYSYPSYCGNPLN